MFSLRSIRTALRSPSQARVRVPAYRQFLAPSTIHPYHSSPCRQYPYKDDQDRESLQPRSTEGSKSGTDDDAAQTDTAFDPSETSPEKEKEAAGKESNGNPLSVSGASHDKSKPLGEEGGPENQSTTRQETKKSSGGGSPEKKGKPPAA